MTTRLVSFLFGFGIVALVSIPLFGAVTLFQCKKEKDYPYIDRSPYCDGNFRFDCRGREAEFNRCISIPPPPERVFPPGSFGDCKCLAKHCKNAMDKPAVFPWLCEQNGGTPSVDGASSSCSCGGLGMNPWFFYCDGGKIISCPAQTTPQ